MRSLLSAALLCLVLAFQNTGFGGEDIQAGKLSLPLWRLAGYHGYGVSASTRPMVPSWMSSRPLEEFSLLVRSTDQRTVTELVGRLGGRVVTRTPSVLSIRLPLASLQALAAHPAVRFIELPFPKSIRLDMSNPEVMAGAVNRGYGLPTAFDGSGVIMGIMDTGIDLTHPDFKRADGTSRIRYVWDQDSPSSANPPPEYNWGQECQNSEINDGTCPEIDSYGHGTHCSGIMAGGGKNLTGMAPASEIIMVKSSTFQALVDGVGYVFTRAGQIGRPCSVNLSLGGHYGPHDGRSMEETALSELAAGPGRVIVAAAGNEGGSRIHLGYEALDEPRKTFMKIRRGGQDDITFMNAWSAGDAEIEFSVGLSAGFSGELVESGWYKAGDHYESVDLTKDGVWLGIVQFQSGIYDPSGKMEIDVVIQPALVPDTAYNNPDDYQWFIKTRGSGRFDVWMVSEVSPSTFSDYTDPGAVVPGDNTMTVGMPATATGLIAVAAYTTKTSWKNRDGIEYSIGGVVGRIAGFSSRGPSADEANTGYKPDIAAPGNIIASAYSAQAYAYDAMLVDDYHQLMSGTSMACPHVNGIVGLMLQADPTLTADKVKKVLADSAFHDTFTGADRNNTWGAGKVRALAAVRTVLGLGYCASDSDCTEGRTCVRNQCAHGLGVKCYMDSDCLPGLFCESGVCSPSIAPVPDAGGDASEDAGADGGGPEPAGGCGCAVVSIDSAADEKGVLKETGVEEISNAKEGSTRAGPTTDAVLKKFGEAGYKVKDRTEILGRMVGASYCAEAAASGVRFTVCEYASVKELEKSLPKRKAIFGEACDEYVSGATLLSISRSADEKGRGTAGELGGIFSSIGGKTVQGPADAGKKEPGARK